MFKTNSSNRLIAWLATLVPFIFLNASLAKGLDTLYAFKNRDDGRSPAAGLLADGSGNLYGTAGGGAYNAGVIFKLTPDGVEKVLHAFDNSDGSSPDANLIADSSGNLYSTTYEGAHCCGEVFKLAPDGTLTVLYSFCSQMNCADGAFTQAPLVVNAGGSFLGTTMNGGDESCNCGVVFELASDGTETVLHAFTNEPDGAFPNAGLIMDKKGNLYGTTAIGGGNSDGTVFRVAPDGTEAILHSFAHSDGYYPIGSLILDKSLNLYGTTMYGGAYDNSTVFKLSTDGTETVLYSFTGEFDGANPASSLIFDKQENLYGTTEQAGDLSCDDGFGCGTVFRLAPDGTLSVLHTYEAKKDGAAPIANLIIDKESLYGTTPLAGAHGYGTVFSLKK
jgi:uncharacterized repeat protein (TIGR03803 family)